MLGLSLWVEDGDPVSGQGQQGLVSLGAVRTLEVAVTGFPTAESHGPDLAYSLVPSQSGLERVEALGQKGDFSCWTPTLLAKGHHRASGPFGSVPSHPPTTQCPLVAIALRPLVAGPLDTGQTPGGPLVVPGSG